MQKSLEILKHIHELYTGDVTDEAMQHFAEKNSEKVAAWQEAFANYELEDVLRIVDKYWTHKSNKTAPRVAQLLAMLNADEDVKKVFSHTEPEQPKEIKADSHTFWVTDPALAYYLRDVETMPDGEVHALAFYRNALNDIIAEMVNTLPNGDKLNFGQKVAIIRRNKWDADITKRVEQYARAVAGATALVPNVVESLTEAWKM